MIHIHRLRVRAAYLGTLVLLGPACGGGSTDSYATVDKFCEARAKTECDFAAVKCTTKPADCESQRKSECAKVAAQTMSATRPYKSKNVQACLDRTRSAYSQSPIKASELAAIEDVCQRVFQGDKKKLDACASQYECEGTVLCDKGLCAAKVEKKRTELCANPGEVCETGSYCAPAGATTKCVPRADKGADCSAGTPCLEALRCDGTCKDRVAAGESCSSSADCSASAAYCDPYFGNKCDTGLTFGGGTPACAGYGGSAAPGSDAGTSGDGGAGDAGSADASGG